MAQARPTGDAHIGAVTRRGRGLLVLGVAAVLAAGAAAPAQARLEFRKDRLAQPRGKEPPVTRLLVQFRQGTDEARREGIARDAGGRPALRLRLVRALAVAPREGVGLEELRARLSASDRVQRVEDDGPIAISKSANDPGVSEQYAIKQKDDHDIDAPGAWTERTGCAKVAVLDTGVQTDHPDLKSNLWENTADPKNGRDDDNNGVVDDRFGGDVVDGKGSGEDKHGHGTHVAGIIGARGNNDRGITGLCWSLKIVAVRILDADGRGTWSREIAGIDYAIKSGAKVINASYGGTSGSDIVRDAIARARDKDVLMVAAAGNDGDNIDSNRTSRPPIRTATSCRSPRRTARTSSRRSPTSGPRPSTWPRRATTSPPRSGNPTTPTCRARAWPRRTWRPPPRCCESTIPPGTSATSAPACARPATR